MLLNRLKLRHFRTYDELDLHLAPGVTLLHGPNAAGKTNVLEAVFCLGTTKSFRARSDRELIDRDAPREDVPRFARLEADAAANGGPLRVEMAVTEQQAVESPIRKQFKLNGKPSRAGDVVGAVKVVLFAPDDVDLITGSPSLRRRYMDLMLCQIDHRYLRLLQEYGRIMVQRNSLLQRLRGHPNPQSLLEFWDDRLVATGIEIMATRRRMLRVLNDFAREAYADLSGSGEELTILYKPSLEGADEVPEIRLADHFRQRMTELQSKEIYQAVTLAGPHRDDLQFLIDGIDAQAYGSRGQQRSIALSLRLAEMRYITNRTGEQPILLLDEALAELDEGRRRLLLRLMESHPQVIATTSNLDGFPQEFRDRATLMHVENGRIGSTPPVHARAS